MNVDIQKKRYRLQSTPDYFSQPLSTRLGMNKKATLQLLMKSEYSSRVFDKVTISLFVKGEQKVTIYLHWDIGSTAFAPRKLPAYRVWALHLKWTEPIVKPVAPNPGKRPSQLSGDFVREVIAPCDESVLMYARKAIFRYQFARQPAELSHL